MSYLTPTSRGNLLPLTSVQNILYTAHRQSYNMAKLQQGASSYDVQELMRRISEGSRRLRDVEDRLEILESRVAAFERSGLEKEQEHGERITRLEVDLKNFLKTVEELRLSVERLSRLTDRFAKKSELKEVERMAQLLLDVK